MKTNPRMNKKNSIIIFFAQYTQLVVVVKKARQNKAKNLRNIHKTWTER